MTDADYPFKVYGVVPPLRCDERTRLRMLTLLGTFPMNEARLELEVLLRGGDVGPAPDGEGEAKIVSPAVYTVE